MNRCLLFGLVTLLAAPAALAQSTVVRSISFSGSGCNNADTRGQAYDINRDGLPDQFEIIFSHYNVQQGPGIAPSDARKNCNIKIHLKVPRGAQFSIPQVQFIGYADLDEGVRGVQQVHYTFPRLGGSPRFATVLQGPMSDEYRRTDTLGVAPWSPCGADTPLGIHAEISVSGDRSRSGLMTTDQIDGTMKHIYYANWRQCR